MRSHGSRLSCPQALELPQIIPHLRRVFRDRFASKIQRMQVCKQLRRRSHLRTCGIESIQHTIQGAPNQAAPRTPTKGHQRTALAGAPSRGARAKCCFAGSRAIAAQVGRFRESRYLTLARRSSCLPGRLVAASFLLVRSLVTSTLPGQFPDTSTITYQHNRGGGGPQPPLLMKCFQASPSEDVAPWTWHKRPAHRPPPVKSSAPPRGCRCRAEVADIFG